MVMRPETHAQECMPDSTVLAAAIVPDEDVCLALALAALIGVPDHWLHPDGPAIEH